MIDTAISGRVLHIALDRAEKRNALNMAMCAELLKALDGGETDPEIGVVLLTGNGAAFCAGMDLEEALGADQQQLTELHERLFTVIGRARKPIVAAVQGTALAAGVGLAANAHIVIAGEDARFGLTEIRIGLWPVIVFRAVALAVGERRATELALTGRIFDAQEALRMGLVAEVAGDPDARAREIAQSLSGFSGAAFAAGLEHTQRIRGLAWDQAGAIGHEIRRELMQSPEFNAAVRSFIETHRTHKQ